VVVHSNNIDRDHSLEKKLAVLYNSGQKVTPDYERLRQIMLSVRSQQIGPHLEAVKASLVELV
jgi:hypothetical protein